MVNASWDIVIVGLIVSIIPFPVQPPPVDLQTNQAYYWVETKGRTLEEIDAIFEGHKHSTVPDVELVRTGKETLDVGAVEQELEKETLEMKLE